MGVLNRELTLPMVKPFARANIRPNTVTLFGFLVTIAAAAPLAMGGYAWVLFGAVLQWVGSLLDIHEARRLVPGQNATTLQVAAGVLGAVHWLLEHPDEGVRLPDELPHELVLEHALPYLGPFVSRPVDWSPLRGASDPFGGYGMPVPPPEDEWQFSSFLVRAPFDGRQ
jgi:hypothetical protein